MAQDLANLAQWLAPLIAQLEPAARRELGAKIALELRAETQRTMRAQTSPDGAAWEARRQAIVQAHGVRAGAEKAKRRRGPMMVKLRQSRYLRPTSSPEEAALAFAGRVARIANIHHHGLQDQVDVGGPMHSYAERPLLGISKETKERIKDMVLEHLRGT